MDTRLQIVERLYEEGENHVPHPQQSETGEDLTREFQAMSQAKFWMDHRRRQRPETAVIDAVVEAAAAAARGEVPGVTRSDRSPLRLIIAPRVRWAVAATLVLAIAGLGLWRVALSPPVPARFGSDEDAPRNEALAEREESKPQQKIEMPALADAIAPAETSSRLDSADDVSGRAGLAAAETPAAMTAASIEWDETDDVVRLRQRIEMLRARQTDEGWDKPLVPLEMMPTTDRNAGVHQAGAPGD